MILSHKTRGTFKHIWNRIFEDDHKNAKLLELEKYQKDKKNIYFIEKPICQNFLTGEGNVTENEIDFSRYIPIDSKKPHYSNCKDLFYGILFYIFYYSNNKLNTREIEFHFSGGNMRQSLEKVMSMNYNNNCYDILNIFNPENINLDFKIDSYFNAFFGVTFKINPISYSIRSGTISQYSKSHLISFTFEGYDEENNKWDVLDERNNINDLIPSGGFKMFYVRSGNKFYSSFMIKQIEPSSDGFWGFSISSFDIHGNIMLTERSICFDEPISEENHLTDTYLSIDPMIDMSDFLF